MTKLDRFTRNDPEVYVFEDRAEPNQWRVECFDAEGACLVTILSGPAAERRARNYFEALRTGMIEMAIS